MSPSVQADADAIVVVRDGGVLVKHWNEAMVDDGCIGDDV
jgi:hypothetical protein